MVASTMAYSMSGSSDTVSNRRLKTSAFTQSRKRLYTVFHLPNNGGRSRQGLPVRAIHNTASTNNRLFPPVRPGSVGLPRQTGSIFFHCASVRMNRSMANSFRSLNHDRRSRGNPQFSTDPNPTRSAPHDFERSHGGPVGL